MRLYLPLCCVCLFVRPGICIFIKRACIIVFRAPSCLFHVCRCRSEMCVTVFRVCFFFGLDFFIGARGFSLFVKESRVCP